MGVMSCSRKDCENIMCRTHVDGVGYICDECESEFKEYIEKKGLHLDIEGQIKRELDKFMNTSKDLYVEGKEISVDDFFRDYSLDEEQINY